MDTIDLKAFGRALTDAGLMDKSFACMSREEVHQVANFVRAFTRKHCMFCEQWQQVAGAPWWVGKCGVDGHEVRNTSSCVLEVDAVPF